MQVPMTVRYAATLADARSSLAALADASPFEWSIAYERLLLDLDAIHGGLVPATFPIADSLPELRRRLEARLEDLSDLGGDPLLLELILAQLDEIRPRAEPGSPA